jgi:hypothetical protein
MELTHFYEHCLSDLHCYKLCNKTASHLFLLIVSVFPGNI